MMQTRRSGVDRAERKKSWTRRRDLGRDNWLGSVDVEGSQTASGGRGRNQPRSRTGMGGGWHGQEVKLLSKGIPDQAKTHGGRQTGQVMETQPPTTGQRSQS